MFGRTFIKTFLSVLTNAACCRSFAETFAEYPVNRKGKQIEERKRGRNNERVKNERVKNGRTLRNETTRQKKRGKA